MAKPTPVNTYPLLFDSDTVDFDIDKWEELIKTNGPTFLHYRSMRCPVGLSDESDIRRPHDHHEACSNGFLYTYAGEVTCAYTNNTNDIRFMANGQADSSMASLIVPRFYDDKPTERVEMTSFDRLYLKEEGITVVNWHTFHAHISGVDRLHFKAVKVIDLVDSLGVRYQEGVEFVLENGQVKWTGQRRPGIDPKTSKGRVCSIRYSYRPYFYVKSMPHEVRLAQVVDEFTGERRVFQMPTHAVVQREIHFEKEMFDAQTDSPEGRQHPGAPSGSFGPR